MALKRKSVPLDLAVPSRRPGRPNLLTADRDTLDRVYGLGKLWATVRECAAFLGVSENTYLRFKEQHPEVQEAYDLGTGNGGVSLRRTQFRLAERYPQMATFLGKNYLGQTDRVEHAGDPTQPVVFQIIRAGGK